MNRPANKGLCVAEPHYCNPSYIPHGGPAESGHCELWLPVYFEQPCA